MSDSSTRFTCYAVAFAVVSTCIAFTSALADPVNVVKLTLLSLTALVVLFVATWRVVRERQVTVAWHPAVAAAVGLLAAFVISAIAAPTAATAVLGTYGRNSGLLAYAAAIVLFLAGTRIWGPRTVPILLMALGAAGLFTASYGLLQYVGVDAINWNNPFNPIIAALGNPDFASAYLGIAAPAAACGMLSSTWGAGWRIASGVTLALSLLAAAISSAVQGPLAAGAGLVVVLAAWLLNQQPTLRKRGLWLLGGLAGASAVVLAAGALHVGPARTFFSGLSYDARTWYWRAALTMFRRHPVLGVGLDHYGDYWRQVRPAASVRRQGGDAFSDAAHSVPLQMVAQGGLVLAVAYAAFTLLVLAALVRGLLRLGGTPRLLLGAAGGAWLAYVVQSLVSIDQVPLIATDFATAGAVVGLSARATRTFTLPGAVPVQPVTGKKRQRSMPEPRRRPVSGADRAWLTAAAVSCLVMAWQCLLPLRANAAVHSGDEAGGGGDATAAAAAYSKANRLLPGDGTFWAKTGQFYESVRQPALAHDAYRRGARHDPFNVFLIRKAASLNREGTPEQTLQLLHRAVELDPFNPATVIQAADFATGHDQAAWSLKIIARPMMLFPLNADLWAQQGLAYRATGDAARASAGFRKALQLDPNQREALMAQSGASG